MNKFLAILFAAALALTAPTAGIVAQQTPGQIRSRPAEGREPQLNPPTIREYKPKSTLVVPQHPVPRAKFPVIDIHSHQSTPISNEEFGRVVKGIRFVSLVDAGDPVAQARAYDSQGADELAFLDITASSDKRAIILELVRRVADEVFIPLTVGGGLRSVEDIRAILRAGADKVSLNTPAVERPALIS